MDLSGRVDGELQSMLNGVNNYQIKLDVLQDDVDAKIILNNSAWETLQTHISMIGAAPECPAFPSPRTMPALDVYFSESPYSTWWIAQKEAYEPVRDAFVYADQQLRDALTAYAVGLAVRNVAYCDWKRELEAACAQYSACYEAAKARYLNEVKPQVDENMKNRIENYKAGETIVHNIKFLLALVPDQEVGPIATDSWVLAFPEVPAKRECDMSALHDPKWVPTPDCPLCDLGEPVFITSHQGLKLADLGVNSTYGPAEQSGVALQSQDFSSAWIKEKWALHKATSPLVGAYIESHRGHYLQDDNGQVNLHPDHSLHWETWRITDAGNGEVFITSHRDQRLADHGGELIMHGNWLDWERWVITKTIDGSP